MEDVAAAAGVSRALVSLVMRGSPKVSDARRRAVLDAAERLQYRPNAMARGLASSRTKTIGVLLNDLHNPFFADIAGGIEALASELGYQLLLGQTGYDVAREEAVLNAMIGRQPDGIVFSGLVHAPHVRERLARTRIPVVEIWDLSQRPVDMLVGFSHLKVGSAVAGYFLSKGWRRVGVASGDDHRARQRHEGFVAAFGTPVPAAFVPAPSNLERGRRALADLLAQDPGLRAVCCSSDQLAQGVMVEAQARGLRVPQDLAVCGFGNAEFSPHLLPSLSTVLIDGPEIGRLAAQMVLARCRGEAVAEPVVDVGFRIVERESTAG